jgi:hypothetical protein
VCNEAALLAARHNKGEVEMVDFQEALDKIVLGAERTPLMDERERRTVAYHEAGHALVASLLPGADPVHRVTIIPRGRALGVTAQLPEEEHYNHSRDDLLTRLTVLMAGRAAVEEPGAAAGEPWQRGVEGMIYDAIIAGASFAGLAVAAQLRGKRVLLLDRKPIGTGQTSACGTLVCTLRALGLEDAILQVHDRLVVHTPGHTFVYPVAEPFCTFDYALLCRLLREQGDADFVLAAAQDLAGDQVQTSQGVFRGDLIVDASGWRAVLGNHLRPDLVRRDRLNFGLETTVAYRDEGLHFWYDPQELLPMGVTWAFPIGELSRIGIGSYQGETRLGSRLDRFLGALPRTGWPTSRRTGKETGSTVAISLTAYEIQ